MTRRRRQAGQGQIGVSQRETEIGQIAFTGVFPPNVTWINPILYVTENTNSHSMANALMRHFHFKTFRDTGEVLYYHDGYYKYKAEEMIKEQVETILGYARHSKYKTSLGSMASGAYKGAVIGHIRDSTYIDREQVNIGSKVNLKNGLLDLDTLKVEPHTPDEVYIYRIPVDYNPNAKCPRIEQFFKEIVLPAYVPVVEEIFAFCLMINTRNDKFIFFLGGSHGGKGTLQRLIRAFLGGENCSHASIHHLTVRLRFHVVELYGKLANTSGDVATVPIDEMSVMKQLTGEDFLPAEKKRKDPFNFQNKAKLIFAANDPPPVKGADEAWWARLQVIWFPNQFMEEKGQNEDKELLSKITTEEELSGLLNIAIQAAGRYKANKGFSIQKSPEETKREYLSGIDPIYTFYVEDCILDPEARTRKEDMYKRYVEFCGRKGITPETSRGFGLHLKGLGLPIIDAAHQNEWRGIRCK